MKKVFFILFMVLFNIVVFSETLQKDVKFTLKDASALTTASFEFVNGRAKIVGENVKSLVIKGTISIKGTDESLYEEVLKNAKLIARVKGNKLEVSLNYEDLKEKYKNRGFLGFFCSWGKQSNIFVDLEIIVPERLNIDFSGVNFDLELKNVKKADLSNVNGSVYVLEADSVECESVNGNISLENIVYKVDCEVVNGNLAIETRSKKINSISFESINGNVEIKIPFVAIGKISTHSITSKTYLMLKGKKIVDKNLEWKGNGSCDINVETINGKIVVEGF